MPFADPEAKLRYQREWKARRRAEYFADKECAKCGSIKELVLDHIDWRDKDTHRIWSWAKVRREAELAKCQVLCWPCHREKTWTVDMPEQGYCTPTDGVAHHGTWGRLRRGCRCGLCKLKNINYRRARKASASSGS